MRTIIVVVLGVTLAACSSKQNDGAGGDGGAGGGGPGSGSTGQAECHAFCQVLAASSCSAQIEASDCEAGCAMSLVVCPTATAAVNACGIASGETQCDQDGFPVPAGCDAELVALDACEQNPGSTGPGTTSSSSSTSSSSGSPQGCIPPNVGGCGNGVSCCVYAGSGSNPASVPVCHLETGDCCIPSGDGCSDDSQCCVGLACIAVDPGDPSMGRFCH